MQNIIYITISLTLLGCNFHSINYKSFETRKSTFFGDDGLPNKNNTDNVIFLPKRQFIYTYYYKDSIGNKYACEIYQDSCALKNKQYSGRLDDWELEDSNQVDKIGLYVYYGKNKGFYTQDETVIKYNYYNLFKRKVFLRERTTVTENNQEIFLHPHRSLCFNSIYVCPYPEIEKPLKIGDTWQRSLTHSSRVLEELNISYGYKELGNSLNFEFKVVIILKKIRPCMCVRTHVRLQKI